MAPFNFFDLPPELRADILGHLVVLPAPIDINLFGTGPPIPALGLFLVSLQMYREASEIFYMENEFIVDSTTHRLPPELIRDGGFLSPQAQDTRRRIHRLTVDLRRVGGIFENSLAPALSDMTLCGTLRYLKIRLDLVAPPPVSMLGRRGGPATDKAPDLMTRSPWQALFKLLDDPDLEHVEVWAGSEHYAIWCPFHETLGDEEKQDYSQPPVVVARVKSQHWIKLDWRAMVNTYGRGHKILRVGDRFR
ncbi:uncharacterized protein B0I36DRAFT_364641 [Microdochium trichocladiopsis]|uniref:F-box domain-containing protein n=1 Tax=Microdochium trichocladiopsis TaxID=1682393 RepID=A0A9P8Y210_9PEZI|nr:uncharacterized protein B0I36DRAFT_364641 [Microdochium trichocladiopsis]KAH7027438.1 hypothetical protein B0I36DRAFT_364641 [Microdochium trichocladiopsis]